MTKHRLKLKRTPEEEAEHQLRKERRREKKRKREQGYATSSKRFHPDDNAEGHSRKWASSDEEEMEYGPQPAGSSSSTAVPPPDYETLKAEFEEQMFRAKMFDALGDDERLDSVEAQFNDFAHVPDHWLPDKGKRKRAHVFDGDNLLKLDPSTMDDEEYAEWIRAGMYRKSHAEEYAEQQRQKAARAAKRAEEKARKAESKRMEREADEENKRKKAERDSRRFEKAREEYNIRWSTLLASVSSENQEAVQPGTSLLTFDDIPWPIAAAHRQSSRHTQSIRAEDLTLEAISSFLFPVLANIPGLDVKKDKKDRLRETFRRFHPDKFEGRFMKRVKDEDKEKVQEAIGQISRVLNSLMDDG